MTDKLSNAAATVLDKLTTMAEKYGPEVTDSALLAVRVNGVQELVLAVAGAALGVGMSYAAYWLGKKGVAVEKADPYCANQVPCYIGSGVMGVLGVVIVACNTAALINVWNWVAIFEPKLWIAKRLMGI